MKFINLKELITSPTTNNIQLQAPNMMKSKRRPSVVPTPIVVPRRQQAEREDVEAAAQAEAAEVAEFAPQTRTNIE